MTMNFPCQSLFCKTCACKSMPKSLHIKICIHFYVFGHKTMRELEMTLFALRYLQENWDITSELLWPSAYFYMKHGIGTFFRVYISLIPISDPCTQYWASFEHEQFPVFINSDVIILIVMWWFEWYMMKYHFRVF